MVLWPSFTNFTLKVYNNKVQIYTGQKTDKKIQIIKNKQMYNEITTKLKIR